jgi:transglutaminase-like putative cysteine protease
MVTGRRDFLKMSGALVVATSLPRMALAQHGFIAQTGNWRNFEITTRLDLAAQPGKLQAWVPLPSVNEPDWFKTSGNEWKTNAASALVKRDANYGAEMLHLEWAEGEAAPYAEVTSRVATRDRSIELAKAGNATPLSDADRKLYTSATTLIPVDGIVKETADKITAGKSGDMAKARAIYEWVVENTSRDPKVRGCGLGDIASMLRMGDLKGKCADLNALFVGLARASGLPARDVYGIRVAPSQFGYKSLGSNSPTITKAQHCRAEVYLEGHGWVPVDPADVRKVVLEEPPGNLPITDAKVDQARATLFGAWEGNWLAYNMAHDIALPGAKAAPLGFLMYPQAETVSGLLDCLDPDQFKYAITAKEGAA